MWILGWMNQGFWTHGSKLIPGPALARAKGPDGLNSGCHCFRWLVCLGSAPPSSLVPSPARLIYKHASPSDPPSLWIWGWKCAFHHLFIRISYVLPLETWTCVLIICLPIGLPGQNTSSSQARTKPYSPFVYECLAHERCPDNIYASLMLAADSPGEKPCSVLQPQACWVGTLCPIQVMMKNDQISKILAVPIHPGHFWQAVWFLFVYLLIL